MPTALSQGTSHKIRKGFIAMFRLVYSSSARSGMTEDELKLILESAKVRNARRGVTGMLLFRDGVFLQLLEGEEVDVRYVYNRIVNDPRHQRVVNLLQEKIDQRDFASWSMGYQVPTDEQIAATGAPGLASRKPGASFSMLEMDPPFATKLILSFAEPMGFATA